MTITLNIFGMYCASGVSTAQVNFATEKAYIEFEPEKLKVQELISIIEKAGYRAMEAWKWKQKEGLS